MRKFIIKCNIGNETSYVFEANREIHFITDKNQASEYFGVDAFSCIERTKKFLDSHKMNYKIEKIEIKGTLLRAMK